MIKIVSYILFSVILVNFVTGTEIESGYQKNHTNCDHFTTGFKTSLKNFYECSLYHTKKNFFLCQDCSEFFVSFTSNYEMLKITYDTHEKGHNVTCISELINIDRLNYWFRIHEEAVKLWEDANCYKCYNWNGTIINGTDFPLHQNYTEDFVVFLNLTTRLESCEIQYKNVSCDKCMKNYTELNKFYEKIKKNYKNNICFDIENSMNRTRRHWSEDLGCCRDDEASFLIFSIAASIIGALPIVFYFSAYYITKKTEDHSPVNDGERIITPNVPSINNQEEQLPGTSNGSSVLCVNNDTSNLYKNTNIKNIVKQNNLDPRNISLAPNAELLTLQTNQSQNLIQLDRSPAPNVHQNDDVRILE